MNWRRWLASLGIIIIAALLTFPLRGVVYQAIVIPLAYVLWVFNLLYLSVPQAIWWMGVVVIVALFLAQSLLPEGEYVKKPIRHTHISQGAVETLAAAIRKTDQGIYFKWQVANRLGKLAYQILTQREHGKPRSVFAPLTSDDWSVDPAIQTYLEKGLHGSFADFPNAQSSYFAQSPKTPLDQDIHEVVTFLEDKFEKQY